MTGLVLLQSLAFGAGSAIGAGLIAAVVLRAIPRAPLFVHLAVIVVAAVAGVAGGIALSAQAMFISDKDTLVALVVVVVAGVVSTLVAVGLGLRLARDARALGEDARRLGAGRPVAAARRTTAELDSVQADLVGSSALLQSAREESERGEEARRELVARIAHDLMAPLASMQAIAETLGDGLSPDPQRHLGQLGGHVTRLQRLVGDLFELSRIDAGRLRLQRERLSLGDLVSDLAAEHAALAHRLDRGIETDVRRDALIDADASALSRALVNVLVNGLEHSPAGGVVTLTVDVRDGAAIIEVADAGPGFTPDAVEHAFETGWRGSDARVAPALELAGGAGLGLAITRAIVEEHGGTARLRADPAGGRVELRLPLAAAPAD